MKSCRLIAAAYLFFATLCTIAPALAQSRANPRRGQASPSTDINDPFGNHTDSGSIAGAVHTLDGHPIRDARIEVRDAERGNQVVVGYSDASGTFALYNISSGNYEVTATRGVSEARERVRIDAMSRISTIDFRLPNDSSGQLNTGHGATVSLSQYRVPAKARSLYEKAAQAMAHGKLDESRKKVDAALAVFPKFAEALTLRGVMQEMAGKEVEAIADFRQAIQYDANYPSSYLALASALNSARRFDEALLILGQAERLAPNLWQTYFEFARTNIGKRQFAAALRNVDRASELQGGPQKETPELHLIRGYALFGLAEMPRAAQELETFLAQQPKGATAESARRVLTLVRQQTITTSK